jgi:hypothetical protein
MPPTSQPITFAGALQLSADPTLPADPIPFNFSGQFVALSSGVINITGAGTVTVPFDGVPTVGAKGVLIRYDAQVGAAPIYIAFNSSATPTELTPGGFIAQFNAAPVVGTTSAVITVTAACQVRFWIFG